MARVLLVDDDREMRVLTGTVLKLAGHEIMEAGDGEAALELLERERPDLILLDIMMPGMDGWEVCRTIKADENLKDIPVAMLSVKYGKEDIEKSLRFGAEIHITKPFNKDFLLETVENLLAGKA
ncbi:MAG: response regulator [Euryarchaeota archaeon]|nr:response regulator [Euryarchaeota archaeon]